MKTNFFDYHLPPERIAQRPLGKRDASRMLVLDRKTGRVEHSWVRDLPKWLLPHDLMVVNQTKVFPARLFATKPETGAKLEVFLLRPAFEKADEEWEALISPAKRIKGSGVLKMEPKGEVAVLESLGEGHFLVRINRVGKVRKFLEQYGHMLPCRPTSNARTIQRPDPLPNAIRQKGRVGGRPHGWLALHPGFGGGIEEKGNQANCRYPSCRTGNFPSCFLRRY